jgi:hypothetical protein
MQKHQRHRSYPLLMEVLKNRFFVMAITRWRDICDGQHCGARTLSSPTKYELVINTKTSKALGLTFRQRFLHARTT